MNYRSPSSLSTGPMGDKSSSMRRRSSGTSGSIINRTAAPPASQYSSSFKETPLLPSTPDESNEAFHSKADKNDESIMHVDGVKRQPSSLLSSVLGVAPECAMDSGLSPIQEASPIVEDFAVATIPLTPRPDFIRFPSQASQGTALSSQVSLPIPDYSIIKDPIGDSRGLFGLKWSKSKSLYTHSGSGLSTQSIHNPISINENNLKPNVTSLNDLAGRDPFRMNRLSRPFLPSIRGVGDDNSVFSLDLGRLDTSRPDNARTNSELSSSSHKSSSSVTSTYSSTLSFLSTSEKFTKKWPRPASMRGPPSWLGRRQRRMVSGLTLESGNGLGSEVFSSWTIPKWFLLVSVLTVFTYGTAALIYSITTWYRTWPNAEVMYLADNDILTLITLAATLFLLSSLVGLVGTLLNSRPLLAVYALLLWPDLAAWLAVGYIAYKRVTFSLDGKLDLAWSEWYTIAGRFSIQNTLGCCGFYDAIHEEVPSSWCYPRTPLPACKGPLHDFERKNLTHVWQMVFSLLPLHLINIVISLICSNHVTRTFGKGIMPRKYRLRIDDVRNDARELLGQFASRGSYIGATRRPALTCAGSSSLYIHEDKHEDHLTKDSLSSYLRSRVPSRTSSLSSTVRLIGRSDSAISASE